MPLETATSGEFYSPSKNISCEIDDTTSVQQVFCQTMSPPQSVTMKEDGTLTKCAGQQCLGNPGENTPTLPYGSATGTGPFRCLSTQQGMSCTVTSGKRIPDRHRRDQQHRGLKREVPFLSDELGELEADPIGILEQHHADRSTRALCTVISRRGPAQPIASTARGSDRWRIGTPPASGPRAACRLRAAACRAFRSRPVRESHHRDRHRPGRPTGARSTRTLNRVGQSPSNSPSIMSSRPTPSCQ